MPRTAPFLAVTCGVVALVGQTGLNGCIFPHSCTEVGCSDYVSVEIRHDPETLIAGEYRFTFDALGESHSCSIVLPDPQQMTGICESGSLQRETAGGPLFLVIHDAPTEVVIEVSRDGTDLGTAAWWPHYRFDQPNGPDCEPTCQYGSGAIKLPDGDGTVEVEVP